MRTENATSERKVKGMSEAAKEARNAYHRTWAKNNPEKVRAISRRYWERKGKAAQPEGT